MAEWEGTINATAQRYLKGASDQTIRRRLLLALLRKYERMTFGYSGYSVKWDVEYSEPEVRQFGDSGNQVFNAHDAYRQLEINCRGLTATDKLTKKQRHQNSGEDAIVNLYDTKIGKLIKALRNRVGASLYKDGHAANNENELAGIESFMGQDGNTVAADLVANPSDSYGEGAVSTALNALGSGTWSSDLGTGNFPNATIAKDWPYGTGSTEYDYIAPKLVNYGSSSWNTGSSEWEDNCEKVLRAANQWCRRLGGDDGAPMCHMLATELFTGFQNFMSARNRNIIPHKEAEDLGFGDALNFDGTIVKSEYNTPAGVGYGLSIEEMELISWQDELFEPDGPEWSIKDKAWLFEVGMFANLRFNPKHFAKYANYNP